MSDIDSNCNLNIVYTNNQERVLIVRYKLYIGISAIPPLEKKSKLFSQIIMINTEKITPQANTVLTDMSKIMNIIQSGLLIFLIINN